MEVGYRKPGKSLIGSIHAEQRLSIAVLVTRRLVFEHWSVVPFDIVARSPAAGELINSPFAFAQDVFEQGHQRLASVLAQILREAVAKPSALHPSAEARARVLIAAAHGFKSAARDAQDMRTLVDDLVAMTVAGMPATVSAKPRPHQPPHHHKVQRTTRAR